MTKKTFFKKTLETFPGDELNKKIREVQIADLLDYEAYNNKKLEVASMVQNIKNHLSDIENDVSVEILRQEEVKKNEKQNNEIKEADKKMREENEQKQSETTEQRIKKKDH